MIEIQFYETMLLLSAVVNLMMAVTLIHNNYAYSFYEVYHRARWIVALCFTIFSIGFFMHYLFQWRTNWPDAASALTVSYFHVGGVLFGWSHISLLNPNYLTRKVVIRDLLILFIGIVSYWAVAMTGIESYELQFAIFFIHALYISYVLYQTLNRVRRLTKDLPQNKNNARWWTDGNRTRVIGFQRSIRISCHLIVLFGIGSIVVTACFPNTQHWPYSVLLSAGIIVFIYIFYALTEYGTVIEAGTNATEDVASY
jgi:hypothetical protein